MDRAAWEKLFKDNLKLVLCAAGIVLVAAILMAMRPIQSNKNAGPLPVLAAASAHYAAGVSTLAQASPVNQAASASAATGLGAGSSANFQTAQPGYTPPAGSGSAPAAIGSAVTPELDPLYPIDPPPYLCKPIQNGGIQPYSIHCPIGCDIRYPCGCYQPGVEIACIAPE